MSRRPLTHAEALTHPWLGRACPSCAAEPGEECRGGHDGKIHGTRTKGTAHEWVDPRDSEPPIPAHQDCPTCPSCTAPCGTASETSAPVLSCCSCGHRWNGSPAEVRQAQRADAAYDAKLELEAATARWPEHLREANARLLERASRVPAPVEQLGLFGEVSP